MQRASDEQLEALKQFDAATIFNAIVEGKGGSQGERRGEGRRQGRRQGQEATATAATLMAVRCNSGGCGSPCGWWCLFLRLLRKRAQEGRSSLLLLAARDVLALAYGS